MLWCRFSQLCVIGKWVMMNRMMLNYIREGCGIEDKQNKPQAENKRVDSKVELNDSPEIPDRGKTSDIPSIPSGGLTIAGAVCFIQYHWNHSKKNYIKECWKLKHCSSICLWLCKVKERRKALQVLHAHWAFPRTRKSAITFSIHIVLISPCLSVSPACQDSSGPCPCPMGHAPESLMQSQVSGRTVEYWALPKWRSSAYTLQNITIAKLCR